MESLIENYIKESGYIEKNNYFKEYSIKRLMENNISVPLYDISLNKDILCKKFDFIVIKKCKLILIEVNFYNSSGSKLNEVCRSYSKLFNEIKKIDFLNFVWITDGKGWLQTKNSLNYAFILIDNLFNINDLKNKLELNGDIFFNI